MKKIILDTDISSDCDDCGALSVIHNLQTDCRCELMAVMCNVADKLSSVAVKSINEWFGRKDILIGQTDGSLFKNEARNQIYTKVLAAEYLKKHPEPDVENATKLYRKILSENKDITIISIGFLNNLADLIESEPDDISPLSGGELLEKSVSKIYIMGGDFSNKAEESEYNIRMDIASAKKVADFKGVPKIYVGFEVGENVRTGHTLWQLGEDSPIRKAYDIFAKTYDEANEDGTYDRPSWDPLTAWYAICDDESFMHESDKCTVSFDDKGFALVENGGNDTYLILDDEKKATDVIENLIGR